MEWFGLVIFLHKKKKKKRFEYEGTLMNVWV